MNPAAGVQGLSLDQVSFENKTSARKFRNVVLLYDRFHGKCHTLQKSGEIKSVATGTHDTLTMVCSGWFGIDGDRFYFP